MQTTISSKGQITVPKAIRDRLHLKPGDAVRFFVEPDGAVGFVPATQPVTALKGMLAKPERALTLDEMEEAIAKGAAGE